MEKHKLKALIAIMGAFALMFSAQAATKKIGNYTWTYTTVKGGVEIGDGENVAVSPAPTGTLSVPAKIGKYVVKSIGLRAFAGCDELTSVKIPKGVTSIGQYAFSECTSLKTVTVPSTVKSIGTHAFNKCSAFESITIPKGVTSIQPYTFNECTSLRHVAVPSTVKTIGNYAFYECRGLVSLSLVSVETIGPYAFANSALTSFGAPARLIGEHAFDGCELLKTAALLSGASVIGEYAFQNCTNLEYLVLPHTISTISTDAFKNAFAPSGRKTVYYEYYGTDEIDSDEDRFKEMLTASGFTGANTLNFVLRCKLAVKSNNKKYGTAVIVDDGESVTSSSFDYDDLVHLVAKPKKGYVFGGWYSDKACKTRLPDDMFDLGDYRTKTIDIYMPHKHTTIYAKFITNAADKKALKFSAATKKLAKTATKAYPDQCLKLKVGASSASRVTYSAKGLPSGLSIDDETGEISGTPTKPGSFTATVIVKSAGGYKITQKVKFTVYVYSEVLGQYQGYARPGTKESDPPALLTFSVNSTGKVSGKVNWKDKSYSFTAQCSYTSPYYTRFSPAIKIGKTTFKPGTVTLDANDNCAMAYVDDGKPAFCAFTKAYIFAADGPLEAYANNEGVPVTDEHDETGLEKVSVALQAKFKSNDTVVIAGTVGGQPVSYSAQLSLKQAVPYDGNGTEFDVVVPVVLYKYKYYRTFWFTFLRDSSGNLNLETPSIRVIDDMR